MSLFLSKENSKNVSILLGSTPSKQFNRGKNIHVYAIHANWQIEKFSQNTYNRKTDKLTNLIFLQRIFVCYPYMPLARNNIIIVYCNQIINELRLWETKIFNKK